MRQDTKVLGRWGEERAAEYLAQKGYEIVQRNYSTRYGEIDIIARDKDILVFVEVKTKTDDYFGKPEEMVDRRKLGRIRRMATTYLEGKEVACRIDVVAIEGEELRHYENVTGL